VTTTHSVLEGDCRDLLRTVPDDSLDAMVTDPPSGLSFMGAAWDIFGASKAAQRGGSPANRFALLRKAKADFSQTLVPIWRECLRILKPGAHILVWSMPKTCHWVGESLDEAGFEVRDVITHLFPTGMPKNRNLSKDLDLIVPAAPNRKAVSARAKVARDDDPLSRWHVKHGFRPDQPSLQLVQEGRFEVPGDEPVSDEAKKWMGWGTALRPMAEFWWLARKPLDESTLANQIRTTGTGAINIEGSTMDGKWPANLLGSHGHDCDEKHCGDGCPYPELPQPFQPYVIAPKASRSERAMPDDSTNDHPTLKTLSLMRQLVRLVTPPKGTVLDPFAGSGSTGVAAKQLGFGFLGIERDPRWADVARRRLTAFDLSDLPDD
jgi:site-specific DNA-methyltransferase (adenine-specific)